MTTGTTTNFGLPKPPLGPGGTADGYNTLLDTADTNIKNALDAKLALAGGTMTGPVTNLRAKGAAAVTTFAGTIARSGTTLTFSSAADAILAGYNATTPIVGTTVVHPTGPVTMTILAWLSSVTCTVDSSGTLAAQTPTSTQFPIAFEVDSTGVLKSALLASGVWYVSGSVGIGTTSPGAKLHVNGDTNIQTATGVGSLLIGGNQALSSTNSPNALTINGGGYTYVTIPNGSVGIGTTTPNQKLHVWGGNVSVADNTVLGATALTDGTFSLEPGAGNWGVTAGWDATFASNAANFNISGGAGNLTQAAAKMVGAVSLVPNRWYKFSYTVTNAASSPAATITTAVASAATALTISNGAQVTYFKSGTAPGTFTINATAGVFTLDGLSLQEVQGGSMMVGADIQLGPTIVPPGTTGNQTINKSSGRVNIAALGTSVTVTNNLVTGNSCVYAVCATNDATAYVKNVVPTTGSFTITLGVAATAETAINWMVVN